MKMMKTRKLGIMLIAAVLLVALAFAGAASAGIAENGMDEDEATITFEVASTSTGTGVFYIDYEEQTGEKPSIDVPVGCSISAENGGLIYIYPAGSEEPLHTIYVEPEGGSQFFNWINVPSTITGDVTISALIKAQKEVPLSLTADEWNEFMSDYAPIFTDNTYTITGTGTIKPTPSVEVGSYEADESMKVILDFSGFKGTFEGVPIATGTESGALFGHVMVFDECTLEIKGLNMDSVTVRGKIGDEGYTCVGGIIGEGDTTGTIIFNDCHLSNCSILGCLNDDETKMVDVGGLLGYTQTEKVIVKDCTVKHSDICNGDNVGGFIGEHSCSEDEFNNCAIENSTIAGKMEVGGLIGSVNTPSFDTCKVKNTSVYASATTDDTRVGGLAGNVLISVKSIAYCMVTNSVIVSGGSCVGGLIGRAGNDDLESSGIDNIADSQVVGSTMVGSSQVGGLIGATTTITASSSNTVENIAVKGGDETNLDCGLIKDGTSIVCGKQGTNYLKKTGSDTRILLLDKYGGKLTSPFPTDFWKVISRTTGNGNPVTNIGKYGKEDGYGVILPVTECSVTLNPRGGNGIIMTYAVPVDEESAIPNPGFTRTGFTQNGWSDDPEDTTVKYLMDDTISPSADMTLYAVWGQGGTTNVTLYNEPTFMFFVPSDVILSNEASGLVGTNVSIVPGQVKDAGKDIVMRVNTTAEKQSSSQPMFSTFSLTKFGSGDKALYSLYVYADKDAFYEKVTTKQVTGSQHTTGGYTDENNIVIGSRGAEESPEVSAILGFKTDKIPSVAGVYNGKLTFTVGIESPVTV